jgi:hypothetical protein
MSGKITAKDKQERVCGSELNVRMSPRIYWDGVRYITTFRIRVGCRNSNFPNILSHFNPRNRILVKNYQLLSYSRNSQTERQCRLLSIQEDPGNASRCLKFLLLLLFQVSPRLKPRRPAVLTSLFVVLFKFLQANAGREP